jgi:hypothetical protein
LALFRLLDTTLSPLGLTLLAIWFSLFLHASSYLMIFKEWKKLEFSNKKSLRKINGF